ncbi:MAG: hypothetical protein ABL907_19210 [Hyphomicrobium sp.]
MTMRPVAGGMVLIAMFATPASAEMMGDFVGPGTYATAEGCKKLAAIAAGTPRNVATVPETLTIEGFAGWEGGCTFHSITEVVKGKKWTANLKCFEGADESQESDVFERMPDGAIKVTIMGSDTTFVRCDGEKGK